MLIFINVVFVIKSVKNKRKSIFTLQPEDEF